MATVVMFSGLASAILSLSFIIFSMASSQWLRIRSLFFTNDVGIMRHCDVLSTYCGDMERLNDLVDAEYYGLFRAIQAFYLLHCVGMLFATVMFFLYLVQFFEAKGAFKAMTVFTSVAFAAGLVTVSVYGSMRRDLFGLTSPKLPPHALEFGLGYYSAVCGCILSAVVALCCALEASRAFDSLRNAMHRLRGWESPYTLFVEQEV